MSHELLTGLGIAGSAIGIGIIVISLTTPPKNLPPQQPGQQSNPLAQAENLFSQAMGAMQNSSAQSQPGVSTQVQSDPLFQAAMAGLI